MDCIESQHDETLNLQISKINKTRCVFSAYVGKSLIQVWVLQSGPSHNYVPIHSDSDSDSDRLYRR